MPGIVKTPASNIRLFARPVLEIGKCFAKKLLPSAR
jgi:hypothetical protein